MNLAEAWDQAVSRDPDKLFLLYRDLRLTYRELSRQVETLAEAMVRGGIRPGERVALVLPNRPELLVVWLAAARIGAIEVPLNPSLRASELAYVLEDCGAKWVWVDPASAVVLGSIRSELTSLERVVTLDDEGREWARWLSPHDDATPSEPNPALDSVIIDPDDPLAIIYTSGTTGDPKGVVLSHRSAVLTGECTAFMLEAGPSDRIVTPNPLFHVNAQFHGVLAAIAGGCSFVLLEKFSRSRILESVREHRATILLLSAAAAAMTHSREPLESDSRLGIRTLLTGGVSPEIYAAFEERFQLRIQTAFAMTEAPVALMAPPATEDRRPTPGVGVPMRHLDAGFDNAVQIVGEDGEPVPPLTRGEIRVRNAALMTCYWQDPEATRKRKRDGWLYTGDIGYVDENGYFFFVGRKKDVIRRRGELIAPGEIERVVSAHPGVVECAVLGVASGLGVGDEEVVAFVVVSADLSADDILGWCEPRLAPYKIPSKIVFRDSFPKTSLGKIRKGALVASSSE